MGKEFLHDLNIHGAGQIQFKTTAGSNAGKIDQNGNDLVLSNSVGDIIIGNGSDDVFIGDGTNTVDIRFEQNMAIFADSSSTRTLTLGGTNTSLVLESPTISGNLSIGTTAINNKLTFTTANGYILFDYEPPGDTGEYSTETPLIKVDQNGSESVILSRISEYRAVVLGIDDTVWLRAGDTGSVIKANVNLSAEVVLMSAEGGFHAYGFPNNDTTWSNRNEFKFYSADTTAANNGLYIGDGGSTQFIDVNRNLKNIGTISSGAITSTGKISGGEIEGTSLDINGAADVSGNAVFHGKTGFGGATTTYNVHAKGTGWAGTGVAIESTTTNGAVLSLFNTARQFQIASRGGTLDFRDVTDSDTVRFIVNSSGHLLPGADSSYNLGSSGTRWSNIYADTLYGDGSNITNISASNSDTVDNLHASSFIRSDANDTATGVIDFTGGFKPKHYGATDDLNSDTRTIFSTHAVNNATSNRPINYSSVYTLGGSTSNALQISTNEDYSESGMWIRQYNGNNASPQGTGWQNWTEVWTTNHAPTSKIANWDAAYTYSQVGHLPLAGGTMTGAIDFGSVTGRAITITGDSGLDNSDASIYLGNAPSSYGWDIKYIGSGSGNDNKLQFISTNAGSPVTALSFTQDGNATFAGDVLLADDKKAKFGDGGDLQIQHTGSESQIFNSTGQLDIRTSSQLLVTSSGGENMIKAVNNGSVVLYHDNSVRFETGSAGSQVTGNFYLFSGSNIHFDNGVSNNYYVRKTGTTLEFKTGGSYNFLSGDITLNPTSTSNNAAPHKLIFKGTDYQGNTNTYGQIGFEDDGNLSQNGSNFYIKGVDDNGNLYNIMTSDGYGQITFGSSVSGVFSLTCNTINTGQGANEVYAMNQNVRTTDDVTFDNLTVTGDLSITGDINSYNVTDLDVTDKTITIGKGQSEANSGGSGIIVDGSAAKMLWDESDNRWEFNKNILALNFSGSSSGTNTGDQVLPTDFVSAANGGTFGGDVTVGGTYNTTYSNDGFNFTSNQDYNITSGSNKIIDLHFNDLKFYTANTKRLEIDSSGDATFAGDVNVAGNIILTGASNEIIKSNGSIRLNIDSDANQTDRVFIVSTGSNSELFRVDESGNGTFAGSIETQNIKVAEKIIHKGDANTSINFTSDNIDFETNNIIALTLDSSQNATFAGQITSGRLNITDAGVPIKFIESGNTGTGKYWRQVLDAGDIRFDVDTTSTNGDGSFSSYNALIQLNADGHTDINGDLDVGGGIDANGDVLPGTDNTHDLGSSTKRWQNVVAVNLHGDGSNITNLPSQIAGLATESYVNTAVSNLVDSAPGTLNTLNELAAALGDDASFSTTVTNSIATKLPLAGGTMTGNIAMGDNNLTGVGNFTVGGAMSVEAGGDTTIEGGLKAEGGIDMTEAGSFLKISDSVQAHFGNNDDLKIYHNSSDSYIENSTGQLRIISNDWALRNASAQIIGYNTSNDYVTFSKMARWTDSQEIQLGSSGDLKIYHDGGNSLITNTTGELLIRDDSVIRLQKSNGENMLRAIADGAVELYHNNAKKIETTAAGISVTGVIADRDIPMVIHASLDDTTSSTSNRIVPLMGSIVETSVSGGYAPHFFITPYACVLKKVIFKNVAGSVSSSFTTELKAYKNGTVTGNSSSGELTASSSAITWTPTAHNDITYAAGDKFSLVYQKSAIFKTWNDVAITIVFTLTDYDI